MVQKQATLDLRKEGETIKDIAHTLWKANTTICNVLKNKETTEQHTLTRLAAADDNSIVSKTLKTIVSDITSSTKKGEKVSHCVKNTSLAEIQR